MYIFVMFQHLYTGPSQNHFILCNFVLAAREWPQAFRETLSYTLKRQYIRLPLPVTKNARVLSILVCPRNDKVRENVWRTLVFRFVGSKIPIYWAESRVCISPLSKVFQGSLRAYYMQKLYMHRPCPWLFLTSSLPLTSRKTASVYPQHEYTPLCTTVYI